MSNQLKYYLGAVLTVPLLPLLYFQAKRIYSSVPRLPEAREPKGKAYYSENDPPLRMLAIGESTVAGIGVDKHEDGFTGTLARHLAKELNINMAWQVVARSGYTVERVEQKLIKHIDEGPLDLIIVGLGGNDAFKFHSPMRWRKDVERLITSLRKNWPDTPIVFSNMPPIKEFPAFTSLIKMVNGNLVELFGKELQELVKEYPQVFYCSEVISLDGWKDRVDTSLDISAFFSDGVHPSKLTYQTWAKDMAERIVENDVLRQSLLSHPAKDEISLEES